MSVVERSHGVSGLIRGFFDCACASLRMTGVGVVCLQSVQNDGGIERTK